MMKWNTPRLYLTFSEVTPSVNNRSTPYHQSFKVLKASIFPHLIDHDYIHLMINIDIHSYKRSAYKCLNKGTMRNSYGEIDILV